MARYSLIIISCCALALLGTIPVSTVTAGEMAKADKADKAVVGHPFQAVAEAALANSPRVREARAKLESAQQKLPQSRAALLPAISLNADTSHKRTSWKEGMQKSDPDTVGLSLKQPLFNWQAVVAWQQTEPYIAAYALDLIKAQEDVLLDTAKVSIELMQNQEVAALAGNNRALMQHHLEATKTGFTVGSLTRTDVSQARARLSTASAEEIRANNNVAVSQARYREVVGAPAPESIAIPPLPQGQAPESANSANIAPQVASRADIKATTLRLQVAEQTIDQQKAAHLPTLDLVSTATRSTDTEYTGRSDPIDETVVKLDFSLPLFAGGATVSKTDEARSDRDAQQAQLDRLRLQAVREIEQALLDLRSSLAAVTAYESSVQASQEARDGINEEFKVGARSTLDVLDAQNELFKAETELAKSRYGVLLANYQLLNATGRLLEHLSGK